MSEYSKGVALILATLFGPLGIDKFYVGATDLGVAQLVATILVVGLIWSGPYAFISILTLVLTILFGINTFFYPEVKWSTKNPSFDKGVAICVVVLLLLSFILSFTIKQTTPSLESLESFEIENKTIDEIAGSIINKPNIVEKPISTEDEKQTNDGLDSIIICKNGRNENYKNMIKFMIYKYRDKEIFRGVNYNNINYKIKGSDIIYKTEEEIKNYILDSMKKLGAFVENLEVKFNNNVNYIHLFAVLSGYFSIILRNKLNKDLTDDDKKNIIENYGHLILFLLSENLFYIYNEETYNDKKFNWEDEIITYEDNKFSYDDKFKSIVNNRILPSPGFDIKGKSVSEVVSKFLDNGIEHSKTSFVDQVVETDIPNLDDFINNEDFIKTFDGSNTKCVSFLGKGQDFKYKKEFRIISNLK
jgi:TM2 domain-containing membrane protein YozV